MAGVGTITALVMECADPEQLARFWSLTLGAEIVESGDGWAALVDSNRGRICFQAVPAYAPPEWPGCQGAQQMHLDILVADLAAATRRVVTWGATAVTEVLDPGAKEWRIFADPAGHPFCLVTVPE